jgi:hypothetical protein
VTAAEMVTVPKDTVKTVAATIVTQLARWSWWKPETPADKDAITAAVLAVKVPGNTVTLAAEAAHRLYMMSSAETLYGLDWCADEEDPKYPMNHPAAKAELDLEGAVYEQARATWDRLVDADTVAGLEDIGETRASAGPEKARPPEPPPDRIGAAEAGGGTGGLPDDPGAPLPYLDRLSPETRAQVLAHRELAARQHTALAEVKVWTWERFTTSQTRRQREIVTVEKHPDYWPANYGSDSQKTCGSLAISPGHGLEPDEYREFHGENYELHPVIWRVTWQLKQGAWRHRQHWCDADLPDEYRPGIPREILPPVKPRKKQPEPSYYATVGHYDRTGQTRLHYWYRAQRGQHEGRIRPWPPGRSHFGVLYKRDIPDEQTCQETFGCTPGEWTRMYWDDVKDVRQAAMREIGEHTGEAAARFAALQSACCCCGRTLTDERSKVYGIGPECRAALPPEALKRASALAAQEQASGLAEQEGIPAA